MNFQELGESEEEKLDEKRVNLMSDGRREREMWGKFDCAAVCLYGGETSELFCTAQFFRLHSA